MRRYRQYRGLYGEMIPVAEDTIATAPRIHSREPFPFAFLAARLGDRRDSFAASSLYYPLIEDALRNGTVRQMLAG